MGAAGSHNEEEVAALLQLRDAMNFPGWTHYAKEGWGDLETHRDPSKCARVIVEDGHVTKIFLNYCGLQGNLPDVFTAFTQLRTLELDDNDITGVLPQRFPASLRKLEVNDNSNLAGVISKDLVLQCEKIDYSNCKKAWDQATGTKNKEYMQGPFIVGVSFASEDIGYLLFNRKDLSISEEMLKDIPKKGDPAMAMTRTHGANWVAWQEVWLTGLQGLHNQKVYVMSLGRDYFRQKFEENTSNEKNLKNCFDPSYALPHEEKASSILDWERRQILSVSKSNNLTIQHLRTSFSNSAGEAPSWYQSTQTVNEQLTLAVPEQELPEVSEQETEAANEQGSKQCCVSQ